MLKSMTAFACVQHESQLGILVWELKSVNSRYCDLNFRLPEIARELEPQFRTLIKSYLSRGKLDCGLRYQAAQQVDLAHHINSEVVMSLMKMSQQVRKLTGRIPSLTMSEILNWPGVMEAPEMDKESLQKNILHSFEKALKELDDTRIREGEKLKQFLLARLDEVVLQVGHVKEVLPEIIAKQRETLVKKCEELQITLDPDRLAQETALLAQRVDVAEELDRLSTHVSEAKRILAEDNVAGRRLDFLMQEFNREANTLGAKSVNELTTRAAVELKVVIEQMREQVQNAE